MTNGFLRSILGLVFFCSFVSPLFSQVSTVSGKLIDKATKEIIFGAKLVLTNQSDSTQRFGILSDNNGDFLMSDIVFGEYVLKITAFGYNEYSATISVRNELKSLGTIALQKDQLIDEVIVEQKMIRVEQNGDTTSYNADAYKTNPDASIEDLVGKMPGITVENGVVKSNGEAIQKVLIDGEEFFGDDATTALKNLPAEIVQKIQVYDKQSDQAQFTGVNDGNESKALNIVTKPGKNNGQFGKIYAGYGTDDRYIAGANVNFFNGSRKISVIGMSNNVNQQNFSSEDILGISGSPANQGRRGGNSSDNFLVNQQNGISQTHSIGINYADKWGQKTKVTGSYFFNTSTNDNKQITNREYILSNNAGQFYTENYDAHSTNYNHRFNFKIDVLLDSNNSLTYRPRVSIQNSGSQKLTDASTQDAASILINRLTNSSESSNMGYSVNNDLLWRHRFNKPKRTFSIDLKTQFNNKDADNYQYSNSIYYYDSGDSLSIRDQQSYNETKGYSVSSKFSYTEPIGKNTTGEFYYVPSYSFSDADKRTSQFDELSNEYSIFDTLLSNVFTNKTIVNQAGTNFRYRKDKVSFQLGGSFQNSTLLNNQTFPIERDVTLGFNTLLPSAMFKYEFSKKNALRVFYRTSTRTPSIDQLQNVIDNSNPLSLSSGNPNLKQQYNHRLMLRYNTTNTEKSTSFFAYLSSEYNQNYITNSTVIAQNDTIINETIALSRGSQYSQPTNLNGSWTASGFLTFGVPIKWLKSNLNINAGIGYTVNPGLINGNINNSAATNLNGGMTLSSNISEKIDFTLSYSINYNDVQNSSQNNANNTYVIQSGMAKINWMPLERLVLNTNFTTNSYQGLGTSFNQTILLWNAGIGYKLLKQKQLEIRISVFDILKENNSIARNVTSTYIEDVQSTVLQRYFMLTATWSLRNFKKKPDLKEE